MRAHVVPVDRNDIDQMWELFRELQRGLQMDGVARIRVFAQDPIVGAQEWW